MRDGATGKHALLRCRIAQTAVALGPAAVRQAT